METTNNFNRRSTTKMDSLVKAILSLLMILAMTLLVMALGSCSKNGTDPDPTPDPTQTGVVNGTVQDEIGNLYPGARIMVSKGALESVRETNSDGSYSINTKDVGSYNIEITPPLSTEVLTANPKSVNVQAGGAATVDFEIQPQQVKAHLNFGEVQLLEEIVDKDGNTPTNSNEPLYAANIFDAPLGLLTAIKAPDDHHVTLAEFKAAKGNIMVRCNGDSSTLEISLEGMIPNGTYTFWLAYLNKKRSVKEPVDFMNDFVNRTNPPVGDSSGTENIAFAETNGTINITLEHPSCILTDEVALVIPILYHINGKTFGGGHVPDPEEVVQMLAYFQ